ncbi:hydrogenase [Desulfuromonas versatilis]|uniref:Hydrogenase n=1 Tax=Desulfuromonas versatilis TaxID=2802975 RepID=A0ABM8HQ03_9BACT|nr:nickel-dependent hydrogenase large subunit [Desulfuromonas versatilis]BCR04155.1 hydrogenase [Desulfuromonas versatilis]
MKTLCVEPLSRVEGHGRVELELTRGRLVGARVCLNEAPRLFEALVLGRSYAEVPALVCRICAICTGVHRIAAAGALEKALGAEVPPLAGRLRELLLLGGHIESHALHLFCLIQPDLAGTDSILELLRSGYPGAREGLELKRLGNRIQELAGGRVIHPIHVEVGGMLGRPAAEQLLELREELARWGDGLPRLLAPFAEPENFPSGGPAAGIRISVDGGRFGLTGERLALSDGRSVAAAGYRALLGEQRVAHSFAKQSANRNTPLLTGALARIENARRAGYAVCAVESWPAGIHANNAAQGYELVWALQRAWELVTDLLQSSADESLQGEVRPGPGSGTVVIEAPRGLLVHHYVLDDLGRVAAADIVTPTAINQAAMEAQLLDDLAGVPEPELEARAQRIIRSFDPCISCAVHLVKGAGTVRSEE